MKHNDEFDRILDDALSEYREAEPLAGVEERVLARVRLASERRRKLWWRWGAVAATAALAAIAWLGLQRNPQQNAVSPPVTAEKKTPPATPTKVAPTQQANSATAETPHLAGRRHLPAHKIAVPQNAQLAGRTPTPEREQFPTPKPLSSDERALLELAQNNPEALQWLTNAKQDDKPIDIAPIKIKPLPNDGDEAEGEN